MSTLVSAPASRTVLIRKSQNIIDISPDGQSVLPDEVRRLLEPELQYNFVQRHYGDDKYDPISGAPRTVTVLPRHIYRYDKFGRLVTNFGFARRLARVLQANGYTIRVENLYPDAQRPRPDCYVPEWDNVTEHFEFKPRQEECLRAIMRAQNGVVYAVTGYGKMAVITMICLLYPQAKHYVVTKTRDLTTKTREYLTRYIPNVGQFGDSRKKWGQRVTVFSVDSLHHCDFDCDFLLADEGHLLVTEGNSKELRKFQSSRNFTFTATPTGRIDGTDKRLEALFGETIFYISYPEAVGLGLVAPIQVEWSDVLMDYNPVANITDPVCRKRRGVWTNHTRNDIIAQRALGYPDEQVMILVETVEHAAHLIHRLSPHGYTMVTGEIDPVELANYKKCGLIPQETPRMTPVLRERLRQEFEAGLLRKVVTTVWNTGIDAPHLQVVIRAGATTSTIDDIQDNRCGRPIEGKQYGIICDFLDQFDSGFKRRADGRKRIYTQMGWESVMPGLFQET